MQSLPFKEFEFHGFHGRRRVISFGWRYDFIGGGLAKVEDMPAFLFPVRELAASFADVNPTDLQHVLLTEYPAGAAIGWHKDRATFGDVIGISLLAPCTFRLRRKTEDRWQRASVDLQAGSIYLLCGPSRAKWEHSIPAVPGLRCSLTFRNVLSSFEPDPKSQSRGLR